MAMLGNETLMTIMPDTTSAMIKMRLKTLKSWIDKEFDTVVGQPSGTLDIRRFNTEVCCELQRKLSRKGRQCYGIVQVVHANGREGRYRYI